MLTNPEKKIVAIIQARMGSTRLPGKTLAIISGKPLIQHVIERTRHSNLIKDIIVATTEKHEDDRLVAFCINNNTRFFRGSENDVLDRFYQCAKSNRADIIVRITADCPVVDPDLIDQVVTLFLSGHFDYISTAYPDPSFPDGLDVEVFSFRALEEAWEKAKRPSEREHVTPYIWKNELKNFNIKTIKSNRDLSKKRWTVDTEHDLEFMRIIYSALYSEDSIFKTEEILDFLADHPEVELINANSSRNEGYYKSLKTDLEEGQS